MSIGQIVDPSPLVPPNRAWEVARLSFSAETSWPARAPVAMLKIETERLPTAPKAITARDPYRVTVSSKATYDRLVPHFGTT
jgi:hypothetical protein